MTWLRWVAVAIAVLAVIDPVWMVSRHARPIISVTKADSADGADAADGVRDVLGSEFIVVGSVFAGADAVVVVGNSLPDGLVGFGKPVFAVMRDPARSGVWIEGVEHPRVASVNERVPVVVDVVRSGRGAIEVELRSGGMVVDRVEVVADSADEVRTAQLSFVPTATGAARLEVVANRRGRERRASADLVVDVRERQWSVLFADQRPSWMSTFVRRTVERDPRFVVSSRITTSRGITTESGAAAALDDRALIDAFDVIVVGAPEQLSARASGALEAYLRRRGGTVVLLMDQTERRDAPFAALTRTARWDLTRCGAGACPGLIEGRAGDLRGSAVLAPVQLPPVAEPVARDSATGRPVVWKAPVGAGTLIVSGATDAWHARDPELSGFATFWPSLLAEAGAAAVPAIDARAANVVVAPGERINVSATMRESLLAPARTASAPSVALDGETLHMEPANAPGDFRALIRAPSATGSHALVVTAAGAEARLPIVVDSLPARATPDEGAALAAWVGTRGGDVFDATQLGELRAALREALTPERRPDPWHPMRSPWWILPFALLLGAEWWLRRRRGLA